MLKLPTKLLRLFFFLMEYFSSDNERITPVNDLLQNYSLKKEEFTWIVQSYKGASIPSTESYA